MNKNKILEALINKSLNINELNKIIDSTDLLLDLNKLIESNQISKNDNNDYYLSIYDKDYVYVKLLDEKCIKFNNLKKIIALPIDVLNNYLIELEKENKILIDKKHNRVAVIFIGVFKALNNPTVRCNNIDSLLLDINKIFLINGDLIRFIYIDNQSIKASFLGIEERKYNKVIGHISYMMHSYYFIPTNLDIPKYKMNIKEPKQYDKSNIYCADIEYNNNYFKLINITYIGKKDDAGIEITKILIENNAIIEFDNDTIKEARSMPDYVLEDEIKGRIDYRNEIIFTIDGDDAKDFDDAISLKILDNGNYLLGVYIADVANYVKENSPLDKEAYKRGTSIYLADRVVPMLPFELSNGICSLNEGQDRLVMAVTMELNNKGKLISYDINEGVINSRHRLTYNNVNKILNNDLELINKYNDIKDILIKMDELALILRNIRFKRGGIDFDTAEYEFILNENGKPIHIVKKIRDRAEMLIEDFMLLANETIAYHMNLLNLPIVYRIHESPDEDKLSDAILTANKLGVDYYNKKGITEYDIQRILNKAKDLPNKDIINNVMLRAMKKARYFEKNVGHYGLKFINYCHFTSPIRRYPDLMTHRLIKKLLLHPSDKFENELTYYNAILPDICEANSKSERLAMECERQTNDMLAAWYMSSKTNKVFDGIITSMRSYGMYVNLNNGIEGLLAFRNMNGYFTFDENKMICYNEQDKYKLGDVVKVKVLDADRATRKIDFILADEDIYENYFNKS